MNAHQSPESCETPDSGLAQALYFKSNGESLFGWLHLPAEGPCANLGLVICSPFGYEATCAHRSIRAFADTAANLGIPALRFDYRGTGDSADLQPQSDQLDAWLRDVLAAIAELQRATGVERVCLLGVRLGALLAALALRECPTVNSLILVAPIVSGPRYLRQLRTMRLAGRFAVDTDTAAAVDSQTPQGTSMEVCGFAMSAATIAALSQIDLASLPPPPPAPAPVPALIIDSKTLPSAAHWEELLSSDPARTEYVTLPGVVEMLMQAPLRSAVPRAALAAVHEWLRRLLEETTASPPPAAPRGTGRCESLNTTLTLGDDAAGRRSSILEQPAFIASQAMLFGIVTQPRQDERRRRGVILLNSGADFHIGANRMHVSLARRWARHGYVVLRLDLSGLGDSSTAAGCPDDDVFPSTAVEEIRAAIDFLRNRYGVGHVTVGGLCSGAYHALRAAAAQLPLNQILMINPQNYFWKKGMRLDELQLAEVVRNPARYLHGLFSLRTWELLLTGKVSVPKIVRVYLNRFFLAIESTFRDVARRFRLPLAQDLGYEIEAIAASGIRMVFLFARGEPGVDLLRLQAGSCVRRLGDLCRVHIIDGGDHIFSQRHDRAVLEDTLTTELLAVGRTPAVGDAYPPKKPIEC